MGTAARINSLPLDGSNADPVEDAAGQLALSSAPGLISLMFASADDLGWQEKELAVALGYDPGYLSRIKSGEKPLPASRLAQLPKTLRRALWTLAAEQDGLIVAPEDVRKRALGQLLVAVGEVLQVFDERAPRATKLMAKANL